MEESQIILKVHDHTCLIYEKKEEWEKVIIPFITEGLRNNEKCIYITDQHEPKAVKKHLQGKGFNTEKLGNQFQIIHEHEAYTREGHFDPDRMIKLLKEETEKAIREGYSGLRVTGEMTWTLKGIPGSERLIEYEAKLNRFFPKAKCVAICKYKRSAFEPETLKMIILTHPIIIWKGKAYRNFYYIPPETLLDGNPAQLEVENWLRNLKRENDFIKSINMLTRSYKSFIDHSPFTVAVKDSSSRYLIVNDKFCKFAGKKESEILGKSPYEIFDEETASILEYSDELPLKGEDISFEMEINDRYYHTIKFPIETPTKEKGIGSIILDITERKKFEEKLEKSMKSFLNIVEDSPESIFITNKDGKVYYANQQALDYFGLEAEDIIGETLGKPLRPYLTQEIETLAADGSIRYAELKTAKTYWEEEECTLISIRDITKIKEYEKSLEKSLREKNTMLAELHHRVKNNLQVIISLIDLQKRHMKSPEDKEQIEKVNNRIKAIARAHERLYLAEDLSSIDLKDYLEDILLELKATYQKPGIQFECQIQDIKLNINQAIPCGLIINEALTNTMKHAFPEGEGRVIIKAYKKDNLININIEDNGVGLPENFKPEETLGMRIMHALTRQLDGEIRIKGEKGVKIRLRFPHPQNRG
ncbi:MAG TPA: PAS domain S-box protein [Methanothermobacter sp.]|nr:PAS domain S-box protein [Methanothermobacter sp.]